jgi:transposase
VQGLPPSQQHNKHAITSVINNSTNMRAFGTEISGNRRPNGELSIATRSAIIARVESGQSKASVAREFEVSERVVYNTINRYKEHGKLESLPRSGRPPTLSRREKRLLFRTVRKSPRLTWYAVKSEIGRPISRRTLYNNLASINIRNWRAKKRPKLMKSHAKLRLKFSRDYRHFRWWTTHFSDECSLERGSGRDRAWVFRFPWEAYRPDLIDPQNKGKDLSFMIWASFSFKGRSKIQVTVRDEDRERNGFTSWSYVNALEDGLLDVYEPLHSFVQDNAKIHTSNYTQDWFVRHGIWVLDFPPNSPDLNPIEHLWHRLKVQIQKDYPELNKIGRSAADRAAFASVITEAWNNIPQKLMKKLIWSMPRRLAAVRRARGWHTKY